jgi:vacuolar protein-sorting-associated protein 4
MTSFMNRAEYIKKTVLVPKEEAKVEKPKPVVSGSGQDSDDDKFDKMLADVIVTEKPNVKWSDVSGLEGAKEGL